MFSYWWFLLPSLHQPRHRHTSGIYASRRCPGKTSSADIDPGWFFPKMSKPSFTDTEQIAKMLQNLANKPSYAKEQYMMTLNPFVENNKARINQFLNSLCEVGDFYETLEVCSSLSLFRRTMVTVK